MKVLKLLYIYNIYSKFVVKVWIVKSTVTII
uniref:Uncharacterized protein n=1 Tax=Arundo donax TaxID=35708 RepID=A0A0A9BVN2_ARUDO